MKKKHPEKPIQRNKYLEEKLAIEALENEGGLIPELVIAEEQDHLEYLKQLRANLEGKKQS